MKCRACGHSKFQEIISLGQQYLSEFRKDDTKPPCYPLDLIRCDKCRQVQLKESTPSRLLYTDNYGYRSGVNFTMRDHLERLRDSISWLVDLKRGDTVIDVGSNDGTLLKFFPDWSHRMGFDLVGKFVNDYENTNIEFRNTPLLRLSSPAKVITAISMFYDLENPHDFLEILNDNLCSDGIAVIQQNYLLSMLRSLAFDNICHEHIFYHSLDSMEKLVRLHELQIFKVETNSLNGGSFRTYLCKTGARPIDSSVSTMREGELQTDFLIQQFSERVRNNCLNLYCFVRKLVDEGQKVYLYGASTRINTLLQYCGFTSDLISRAVERNPEKYGTKIASVGIPIISEEQARLDKPDYMLVGPYFFKEEFIKRESEYLKMGGKMIFPLPFLEVISHA